MTDSLNCTPMIAILPDRGREPLAPSTPRYSRAWHWIRVAALLGLAGVLVVNHGCHGDQVDDELSATRARERLP
jgi:hypothetical protein